MIRMLKLFIFTLLVLSFAPSAQAQSADDYFHLAARQYIDAHWQLAQQAIQQGLRQYPNDARLKALAEKMKKQRQKQQQQQNQQQDKQKQAQMQKAKKEQQKKQDKKKREQKKGAKKRMDKKEAERILNAMREDEREAQKKKAPVRANRRAVDKDW